MSLDEIVRVLSMGTSAAIGAVLGILRSKILVTKYKSTLHHSFLGFSIFLSIAAVLILILYIGELSNDLSSFNTIVVLLTIVFGILLFYVTRKHLVLKDVFKTIELDPIVNDFTSNADKNEIKLFGGDLNFFGNTPAEMEKNEQYTHLRSLEFKKILILCESPKNSTQKTRYGKILVDMPYTELRFYHPEIADLRVRGRIIKITAVDKLLIYTKIKSGTYQAIETDTANSTGARYIGIWNLVWSLAAKPSQSQIEEFKSLL